MTEDEKMEAITVECVMAIARIAALTGVDVKRVAIAWAFGEDAHDRFAVTAGVTTHRLSDDEERLALTSSLSTVADEAFRSLPGSDKFSLHECGHDHAPH